MGLFKVPAMRVVTFAEHEYKDIKFALDRAAIGDEILRMQVKNGINRPFLIIMEYIPGFDLTKCIGP